MKRIFKYDYDNMYYRIACDSLILIVAFMAIVCGINLLMDSAFDTNIIEIFREINTLDESSDTTIKKLGTIWLLDRKDVECLDDNVSDIGKHLEYAMGEFADTILSKVCLLDYNVEQSGDKYLHKFKVAIDNTGVESGIVLRDRMNYTSISSPIISVGVRHKSYVDQVRINSNYSNLVIPYGSTYIIDCEVEIPESQIEYIGYAFGSSLKSSIVKISPHYIVKEPAEVRNIHTSQYNDLELYKCGDTISINKADIVVRDRYFSKGSKEYNILPREGRVLSNVTIEITNTTEKGYNTVGEFEFYLVDGRGVTFRESSQYNVEGCISNNGYYLMPGETREYVVIFESDVADHRLIIKDSEEHKFDTVTREFVNECYSVKLNKASIR